MIRPETLTFIALLIHHTNLPKDAQVASNDHDKGKAIQEDESECIVKQLSLPWREWIECDALGKPYGNRMTFHVEYERLKKYASISFRFPP